MRLKTFAICAVLLLGIPAVQARAADPSIPPLVRAFVEYRQKPAEARSKAAGTSRQWLTGVRVVRNVEYGRAGWASLRADLYFPQRRREKAPAVLYIHGGGWALGDRSEGEMAGYLAHYGYVVASIDYRLCWLAKFPAAVEDCKAAVRWMRANSRRLGVDPERIGVWGASAGGHLAMMVGCADASAGLEGNSGNPGISSRVRAVCSYFGPSDLAGEFANPFSLGGQIVQFFMGPFRSPRDFVAASPVSHVGPGDPPLLMLHGDRDGLVPFRQSQLMFDAYRRFGLDATLIAVRNADHGFMPKDLLAPVTPNSAQRWNIVLSFFDRHLKGTTLCSAR
ncbi:MAG: alpha/beta hydrolase [Candidatus Wallbacteria bacterium]|nr:alpha/beta hydrolase [Candidatus Wallbacteria bacterium]